MADIDPKLHTLTIHGLVDQPLTLTMDNLKRFPSVTRLHFIECAGNRHTPRQKTVQETHGMTSCAEWTDVLLSTLLKECGLKGSATWFVAEGRLEHAHHQSDGRLPDRLRHAAGQLLTPIGPRF
jgi:sulfane dehydrogenase subunit SoxC